MIKKWLTTYKIIMNNCHYYLNKTISVTGTIVLQILFHHGIKGVS